MYRTYIMKVWLTTTVVAPIIFVLLTALIDPDAVPFHPIIKSIILLIFVGFIVSIPTLLGLSLFALFFEKKIKTIKNLKIASILISTLGILATLLFFVGDAFSDKEMSWMPALGLTYGIFVAVFGALFRVRPKQAN